MAHVAANPNQPPAHSPEHSTDDDPYQFLTARNVEQMREAQKQIRSEELKNIDPWDVTARQEAEDRAAARNKEVAKDYLLSFDSMTKYAGMDPAEQEYQDVYMKYQDYLGKVSIDQMNDNEWEFGQYDKDGNKVGESGHDMINEIHDQELDDEKQRRQQVKDAQDAADADAAAASQTPQPTQPDDKKFTEKELQDKTRETSERGHELLTDLHESRDLLAQMALKRQMKLMNSDVLASYKLAHRVYNDALIKYGRFYQEMQGEDRTDDEKNASAIRYLLKEATVLRELTNEKWANTKVGKVSKWLAKGNFAQRVAKGVAVGAVVAGGTAIITAATAGTGTIGILAGGAGAVAAAGARGMRTFGSVRGRAGEMAQNLTQQEYQELEGLVRQHGLDQAARYTTDTFERSVNVERGKNKKAVYWAMGSVAFGATLAEGAHLAADHGFHYTDKLANAWDKVRGAFGHHPDAPQGVGRWVNPTSPGMQTGVQPPVGGGSILDHTTPEQYNAMVTVDKGMGGVKLFKELGLKPSDWYHHEDALLKAHPKDFYRMSDGHVGLSHPGKLSNSTMIDIAKRTGIWKK